MLRWTWVALSVGCVEPGVVVTPAEAPATGYAPVTLDVAALGVAPGDVTAVRIGGVAALDLTIVSGAELTALSQGGEPGVAAVEIEVGGVWITSGEVVYAPPIDPLFERMMAIGASLTQGTIDGVPTRQSQLAGPGMVIARQAGAWFPLPLLKDGLFQPMRPADIGQAPECEVPGIVGLLGGAMGGLMSDLQDPETGLIDYRLGREDPALIPANLAVGGYRIADILDGVPAGDLGLQFLGRLTLQPEGGFDNPVVVSQVDLVEAARPSLILSTDLFGNDVIYAIAEDELDPSALTPVDELSPDLAEAVARLAGTDAQVFLGNLPDATLSPMAGHGADPADVAEIVERGALYNTLLAEEAARYDNVHVVDLHGFVQELIAGGGSFPIGEQQVTTAEFGGMLSLDGLHFTATGYGIMADRFLDAIEAELGVSVPRADLEGILAADDRSPWALTDAGIDVAACD